MAERVMPFSAEGYQARADECVRLASDTADRLVRSELLNLAQLYARLAQAMQGPVQAETSLARH
jgi:hypothetical protein